VFLSLVPASLIPIRSKNNPQAKMKKSFMLLLLPFLAISCSTLTQTQVAAVNQFARTSKGFSAYPSKIMDGLAEIRLKRGVYFANSLDNAKLHLEELNSIYTFRQQDYLISRKVDITFKVIDKYAQSLLLLSSDKYEKDLGQQAAHFGDDLDSLTVRYNSIDGVQRVPEGIGGSIGQLVAFGGRQFIRAKQAREIRKFVPRADTLIAVMTSNLLEFLQSANIKELIANEEAGVNDSYLSYLRHIKTVSSVTSSKDTSLLALNTKSSVDNDRQYLEMKTAVDAVKKLAGLTINATKKLRKAHAKLLQVIEKRQKLKTAIWEIQQLYDGVKDIRSAIEKIDKTSINSYGSFEESNS
jgi:hypothetical protein